MGAVMLLLLMVMILLVLSVRAQERSDRRKSQPPLCARLRVWLPRRASWTYGLQALGTFAGRNRGQSSARCRLLLYMLDRGVMVP